jgi:glycosyltransferase involved in cell wall biosynthesis
MPLNVIDDTQKVTLGPSGDGTYAKASGGTEMMAARINTIIEENGLSSSVRVIHSRVRQLDEDKKNILVCHDLWEDPESRHLSDPELRKRFAKIVFVSHSQYQGYHMGLGVPYADSAVIRNAIDPIELYTPKPSDKIRLIYHTTPHRGLELLIPCMEELAKVHGDKIHLDVYSSFAAYGWEERDTPYLGLFDRIKNHPQMTYHGYQPNDVVREALKQAHIFAYPNIWPETSCIAAIEAMSAGCEVVCPSFAALPETTAGFATMYPFTEDKSAHANVFVNELNATIINRLNGTHDNHRMDFAKTYIDNLYSWGLRTQEWLRLMRGL